MPSIGKFTAAESKIVVTRQGQGHGRNKKLLFNGTAFLSGMMNKF